MGEGVLSTLHGWDSFYVIIGSSAAALTGLQFVVIALIADIEMPGTMREVDAFGTPTVVHFCAVLLISAILSAPWRALSSVALAVGACGVAGIVYMAIVIRRARRQTGYAPVTQDWIWYSILPMLAYVTIAAAAIGLPRGETTALFVIAAAGLLLLFIGIRNAWDTVTYIAVERPAADAQQRNRPDQT